MFKSFFTRLRLSFIWWYVFGVISSLLVTFIVVPGSSVNNSSSIPPINGVDGMDGRDGTDGEDGTDGSTPYIGANGNWFIDDIDTGIPATGPAGEDGQDGTNGNDGIDGRDGTDGEDGTDGLTPYIGANGNWFIGDTDTGVSATTSNDGDGRDGTDGLTPYIGDNGNWFIGDTDTGIAATGPAGVDGQDGTNGTDGQNGQDGLDGRDGTDGADGLTPYIGANGNWFIGDTDTGIPATGPAGTDGQDGTNGNDGMDGRDGTDGTDGLTPYIGDNGNWFIGDTDTGIAAAGQNGTNGTDGMDGTNGTDGQDGQDGTNGTDGVDGQKGLTIVTASNEEQLLTYLTFLKTSPGVIDTMLLTNTIEVRDVFETDNRFHDIFLVDGVLEFDLTVTKVVGRVEFFATFPAVRIDRRPNGTIVETALKTYTLMVFDGLQAMPGQSPVFEIETEEYVATITWTYFGDPILPGGTFFTGNHTGMIVLTPKRGYTPLGLLRNDNNNLLEVPGVINIFREMNSGVISFIMPSPTLTSS
jgi:hypothetical protein